jgi:hypothetical protein
MAEELGSKIGLLQARFLCTELQVVCGMQQEHLQKVQHPSLKYLGGLYIFFLCRAHTIVVANASTTEGFF